MTEKNRKRDKKSAGRVSACFFPTWKTIRLGTHNSISQIKNAFNAGGFRIGSWGSDILDRISLSPKEIEIDLTIATLTELGFKDGAYYRDIMKRIKEIGFDLCPAEVGPELRLQYPDQPRGEWILVAMEPIEDSAGYLGLFNVEHVSGSRWLLGFNGDPDDFWGADERFVFVRRK